MTASKRAEGRSYEEFVEEFMDWWLDELEKRGRDENAQATER